MQSTAGGSTLPSIFEHTFPTTLTNGHATQWSPGEASYKE